MTTEEQLRFELRRMRHAFAMVLETCDVDPEDAQIRFTAKAPDGSRRELATVTVAEMFASTDTLVGDTDA